MQTRDERRLELERMTRTEQGSMMILSLCAKYGLRSDGFMSQDLVARIIDHEFPAEDQGDATA